MHAHCQHALKTHVLVEKRGKRENDNLDLKSVRHWHAAFWIVGPGTQSVSLAWRSGQAIRPPNSRLRAVSRPNFVSLCVLAYNLPNSR